MGHSRRRSLIEEIAEEDMISSSLSKGVEDCIASQDFTQRLWPICSAEDPTRSSELGVFGSVETSSGISIVTVSQGLGSCQEINGVLKMHTEGYGRLLTTARLRKAEKWLGYRKRNDAGSSWMGRWTLLSSQQVVLGDLLM
jgi:hypothetical protein